MSNPYARSRALAIALSGVLVFAAFALGAAHAGTAAATEIGVWLVAGAWFVLRRADPSATDRGRLPRGLIAAGAALLLYLCLQLVPLPAGVLAAVSPAAADLHRRTADSLPVPAERLAPIAPVGDANRQAISVEDRDRIRSLARAGDPGANHWRPIALYPFAAYGDCLRYLAYGLVFWIAASISAPRVLLGGVATAGIAVAAIGIIQRATWNGELLWAFERFEGPPLIEETRVLGPFVNPNHFAAFVAMALFPAWALAQSAMRGARRKASTTKAAGSAVLLLGCAVIVASLVGSASRGALVGTLAGAVFLVAAAVYEKWQEPARDEDQTSSPRLLRWAMRAAPGALGIVILAAGFFLAGAANRAALDRRLVTGGGSLDFRLDLWSQSLGMLRDFPIFGVGVGSWREAFLRYERYPLTWLRPNHAHNDYLEWASEVGLVGVALTVAWLAFVVRHAVANRSIPGRVRWPIIASVVVIAIHSIGDFSLRAAANALVLSVLLGLLCNRQWKSSRRREAGAPSSLAWNPRAAIATAAVAGLLCFASGKNLRESLQWAGIHDGSSKLAFAPAEASSWEDLGVVLYQGGFRYQPPTAEAFRAAIVRRPTGERAYWLLSLASPRLDDRRRAVEAALVLHPSSAPWRIEYAAILERSGEPAAALAELELAAYLDPRFDSHRYLRGERTLAEPVVAAVERGFLRATAERPGDANLLVGVASFYEAVRNDVAAGRAWREAALSSGNWTEYAPRAAEAHLRRGDAEEADRVLRELIARAPRFEGGYERLALEVLLPAKRFDEAIDVLASGATSGADVASLEVARAAVEIARGDELRAREALQRAEASARWHPETQYRIGKQYLALIDLEQASKAFERATQLEPNVAWYAFMLGEARERMYDLGKALESYRRAAVLNPDDVTVRRRIERIEKLAEASAKEIA
ncbi:MAG: O-antigen ligase family protein, partial [Candidatus Binatia bacterium]